MYAAGAGYIPAAQARILRIRGCGFRVAGFPRLAFS